MKSINSKRRSPPSRDLAVGDSAEPVERRGHARGKGWRPSFEARLSSFVILACLPSTAFLLALLWAGDYPAALRWAATLVLPATAVGFAWLLRSRISFRMQTLLNAVLALREGDYSVRIKEGAGSDTFGRMITGLNGLGEGMRQQRLAAVEATALLRKVVEEIPVAVLTFDQHQKLQLINRAGEQLLGRPAARAIGVEASDLELQTLLEGDAIRTVHDSILEKPGRWEVRRSSFREGGACHTLLVVHDMSQALREEERQAWQRLIRVMAHELNNSLAPIKSISTSLREIVSEHPIDSPVYGDLSEGLNIISGRSEALGRFMNGYGQLARLPLPNRRMTDLPELIRRTAALNQEVQIISLGGPRLSIFVDPDQIEQVVINLLRNAADAVRARKESEPETEELTVRIEWIRNGRNVEIRIEDDGCGVANSANLFVPFFTTKPNGSGIGLALCREIVEAHGGTITLRNRIEQQGCEACIALPVKGI